MTRAALFSLCGLLVVPSAFSFQWVRTDIYTVATNDALYEQVVVMADRAAVLGTVHDDLFIFANEIDLPGATANDVWTFANAIRISGTVGDHARLFGNSIHFGGLASNSLSAVGAAVQMSTGAVVQGSVNILANSATVEGRVGGNLRIMADQATLTGACEGDARIIANDIVVTPGAIINGNLTYTSPRELILDPKVILRGELVRQDARPTPAPSVSFLQMAILQAYFMLGAFVCGLAFTGCFPKFTLRAAESVRRSSLRCVIAGLIGFFLIPMIAMMAVASLVGIPLSIVLFSVFGLMLYLAKIIVALALGGVLLGSKSGFARRAAGLFIGLAIFYAATLLPAAGAFVWFLVVIFGFGAMIVTLIESQRTVDAPPDLPKQSS